MVGALTLFDDGNRGKGGNRDVCPPLETRLVVTEVTT